MTLAVVAANPDEAYNEVIRLQRLFFPEIEDELKVQDEVKQKIIEEERNYVWMLTRDARGFLHAERKPIEELPEEHKARQIQGALNAQRQVRR